MHDLSCFAMVVIGIIFHWQYTMKKSIQWKNCINGKNTFYSPFYSRNLFLQFLSSKILLFDVSFFLFGLFQNADQIPFETNWQSGYQTLILAWFYASFLLLLACIASSLDLDKENQTWMRKVGFKKWLNEKREHL